MKTTTVAAAAAASGPRVHVRDKRAYFYSRVGMFHGILFSFRTGSVCGVFGKAHIFHPRTFCGGLIVSIRFFVCFCFVFVLV